MSEVRHGVGLAPPSRLEGVRSPGAGRGEVHTLLLLIGTGAAGLLVLQILPFAERQVAAPAFAALLLALTMVVVLWRRDGELPVMDAGALCAIATALYTVVPLLGYLFSGLQWSILSDMRLFNYSPTPKELGSFVWRHVVYLGSFVVAYLVVRGRGGGVRASLRLPDLRAQLAIVILVLALTGYFLVIEVAFGVSLNAAYSEVTDVRTRMPYFLYQLTHNLERVSLILKAALIALLLTRWRSGVWRGVLIGWLVAEIVMTVAVLGARSRAAILLLSAVLLYHRLVKPLTWRGSAMLGSIALMAVLAYGLYRDYQYGLSAGIVMDAPLWSASNEFQALLGTSYDLYSRQRAGVLGPVPWQVYASDVLILIPSQLLPFTKVDPSEWYLEVAELRGTGWGGMFGVISQSVVGLGQVELVLRGVGLGVVLALFHRWYMRNASSFWITALYLTVCLWIYYTFRATTLHSVYFLVYSFLPAVVMVRVLRTLLRNVGVSRAASPAAAEAAHP